MKLKETKNKSSFLSKISDKKQIIEKVNKLKAGNSKIVFSNGCFDIVHRGHVEYLSKAAEFGDYLIIGLNSDASVKRLKGKNKPVQTQDSRAIILAAFGFVDAVVIFEEDTPYKLIKLIKPDVLVKGADYKKEDIIGYDIVTKNGGEVRTIELTEGFSSSKIINSLKK